MLGDLHDSVPGPYPDRSGPQMDCVLGPSRAGRDPIDQWENEGGCVPSGAPDRRLEPARCRKAAAAAGAPWLARSGAIGMLSGTSDLQACGRCHGPIRLARVSVLGRLLSYCIAVQQYHCADPACGWSGLRRNPGATVRSLPSRA
jgi:hypothetical protein